ncbi:hypothetical protein Bhyg_04270 [Pseudolycoriella hygida]|uniref:Uncharacterized protein n=1 Tax=Pseudolycoriella hygida TaxID=35572 RepID=A0A9Q0NF11_9DIPT|nr:hypothetical protein Bhyg_04270 [Pseudolycoriella hygida]
MSVASDVKLLKEIDYGASEWKCTKCRQRSQRRSIISNGQLTPNNCGSNSDSCVNGTHASKNSVSEDEMSQLQVLKEGQLAINKEMITLGEQVTNLQNLGTTVVAHGQRNNKVEENAELMMSNIHNLTDRINQIEQKSSTSALQLIGIPQRLNEDLQKIINDIGSQIGVAQSNCEVLSAIRLNQRLKQTKEQDNIHRMATPAASEQKNA